MAYKPENTSHTNILKSYFYRLLSAMFVLSKYMFINKYHKLAALSQMVACLPLVQQVRGSNPGGVVNFYLEIFNFGARRGGDVHFLIARLYITGLD